GVVDEGIGIVYTRTGRRFFNDRALEAEFLATVNQAVTRADLWSEFNTTWMVLDCELMPWSAKAQELLQTQYAAVGTAGRSALQEAMQALEMTASHNGEAATLLERYQTRATMVEQYTEAY